MRRFPACGPKRVVWGRRFTLWMRPRGRPPPISAGSPRGDMKFSSFTGRMDGIRFVNFLKKLHADVGRPLIVIADNASYHKGGVVQRYIKQTRGQVTLGSR